MVFVLAFLLAVQLGRLLFLKNPRPTLNKKGIFKIYYNILDSEVIANIPMKFKK